MQLNLGFLNPPDGNLSPNRPTIPHWDQLDLNARKAAVHVLARAIAQTLGRSLDPKTSEHTHDR